MAVGTEEKKYRPGKRAVSLGIVLLAVIVSVIVFRSGDEKESIVPGLSLEETPRAAVTETDTDGDGLLDWQEILYGTNPNSPDSDNDGVGDLLEHQTTLAQEDKLREQSLAQSNLLAGSGSTDWASLSYEDQVARLLLTNYFTFKQAGVSLNNENLGVLVDKLPEYTFSNEIEPYTQENITIINDTSATSLRLYGNTVGSTLLNTGTSEWGGLSAAYAFATYSEMGDPQRLAADVRAVVDEHRSVEMSLAQIQVPRSAISIHLDILNALKTLIRDLEGIAMIEESAVTTLAAFGAYQQDTALLANAFDQLGQLFVKSNVIFEENEPGYALTQ